MKVTLKVMTMMRRSWRRRRSVPLGHVLKRHLMWMLRLATCNTAGLARLVGVSAATATEWAEPTSP